MEKRGYRETIPIREGEDFDLKAVRQYLLKQVEDIPDEPIEVQQFPTGSSNLTYLIRVGNWEAVLRRPPSGPLPPKAHDMGRESKFLTLLYPYFSKVPKPYVFCPDENIIGVPFYVMERKKGIVLDLDFPTGYKYSDEVGRRISCLVVDALAELHRVDYKKAGLDVFGHPHGFVERQVHGWIKRYERSQTDDIPAFDRVSKWLVKRIPESKYVTIIHNDYKLNNMLFSYEFDEISAILDWEMSTIADPIFDLGITLGYWIESGDSELLKSSLPTITTKPGFFTRAEFIDRYASKTGFDVSTLPFFMTFAYFKLAVVIQQIYYRWKKGQTKNDRFAHFIQRVRNLMDYADELTGRKEV